jgi:hypothetical protein
MAHGMVTRETLLEALKGSSDMVPWLEMCSQCGIQIDLSGYARGYCSWPYNFDPFWLKACGVYEYGG